MNLPAFENKKYAAYDRFHGNGPYSEIPTKKGPIRTLGFALPYNNAVYFYELFRILTSPKTLARLELVKIQTTSKSGLAVGLYRLC